MINQTMIANTYLSRHKSRRNSTALGVVFLFSLQLSLFGQTAQKDIVMTEKPISLLGTNIPIRIYKERTGRSSPITYVALHHNEHLGTDLVKDVLKTSGGKLVEVISLSPTGTRRRLLHFTYRKSDTEPVRDLCVDPNRIFSESGIKKTLAGSKDEGCKNTELDGQNIELINGVGVFAREFLEEFTPRESDEVVVAIHNNRYNGSAALRYFMTENPDEYANNEGTYIPKGDWDLRNECKPIPNYRANHHDFYMATNRIVFSTLIAVPDSSSFIIALQKQQPDDQKGYLSTYCSLKKINYLIIEAEHKLGGGTDHGTRQKAMIDRVVKAFTLNWNQ